MGRPVVARLVEAGHDVREVGRSPGRLAEVAAEAEVVVVCVFDDEQVRQVCLDGTLLATMAPGSARVVHTTVSPLTIEAIAARAADGGVDVVDAPVSGGPQDAATGSLTLFVGGADETVARLQPVLGCYGDPVLHVRPSGAGQKLKLINNALFAGQIGLLGECVRFGERLGLPESTLLAALRHGSAVSRGLELVARHGSVASFTEARGEFLGKDVAVIRGVAGELGCDLGVLDDVIKGIDVRDRV